MTPIVDISTTLEKGDSDDKQRPTKRKFGQLFYIENSQLVEFVDNVHEETVVIVHIYRPVSFEFYDSSAPILT